MGRSHALFPFTRYQRRDRRRQCLNVLHGRSFLPSSRSQRHQTPRQLRPHPRRSWRRSSSVLACVTGWQSSDATRQARLRRSAASLLGGACSLYLYEQAGLEPAQIWGGREIFDDEDRALVANIRAAGLDIEALRDPHEVHVYPTLPPLLTGPGREVALRKATAFLHDEL